MHKLWFPTALLDCLASTVTDTCQLTVVVLQFGHAQHFEHELHQEGHHEATEGH